MSFDVCSDARSVSVVPATHRITSGVTQVPRDHFLLPSASQTFSKTYSKHQHSLADSSLTVRYPSSLFCTGIKEISRLMFLLLTNVSFTSSSLFCVWTLVFFSAPMVAHQLQINCHNCSCFCMSLNPEDHRCFDHFILSICPKIRQTLHSDSHDGARDFSTML